MFEVLNDISVIILDVVCFRIFFDAIFLNFGKNNKWRTYTYFVAQTMLFVVIIELLSNHFWFKELGIVLSTSLIMSRFKKIKLGKSLLASIVFLAIMLATDNIALRTIFLLFNSFSINDIGSTMAGRFVVVIEKNWLLLVVLFVKMRTDKKRGYGLIETEWIRFIFFPIFTIITVIAMIVAFNNIQEELQGNVLFAIAFGMVVMNIFMYYLIDDIIEREMSIKEKELEYAQFKNQVDVYKTLEEGLERQKEYVHEFKNHILCVENLVKDKDYDTLEKYVLELNKSDYLARKVIDTNNTIVNTILNEKYNEMINKGIVFVFRINDLSDINIEDEDLVVILSNLLNNAIEACEKCIEEKTIKLKFVTEEDMIILSVKNTSVESVIYEDGVYKTSKMAEKDEHGIGIRNIQRTIEKYGGAYSIKYSGKEFYFAILFPLETSS